MEYKAGIIVIGMVCFLVAIIMLMQMIQHAFNKEGFLWGIICMLFPPGTYKYCRKNWQQLGTNFIIISVLTSIGGIFIIYGKLIA